ncbi:DUF4328 domain-containing protein [Streptomyces sp. NPDC005122]
MDGTVRVPRGQARFTCGALAAFALVSVAAWLAAWHEYQLLGGPPVPGPYNPLAHVDANFRNLTGWWSGLLLVALILFSIWLAQMRNIADGIWRQGQRWRRGWLIYGWVIPVVQFFILKMFINDLWAAGRPEPQRHRRGHLLLTAWWLSILVAVSVYDIGPLGLKYAATTSEARQALCWIMFSGGLDICAAGLSITVVWQLIRRLERAVPTAPVLT